MWKLTSLPGDHDTDTIDEDVLDDLYHLINLWENKQKARDYNTLQKMLGGSESVAPRKKKSGA